MLSNLSTVRVSIGIKIGDAAQRKDRDEAAWLLMALAFGLVIPAVTIATMAHVEPAGAVMPL